MFQMMWEDDESYDIMLDGEYVANVNHDEHGHAGMILASEIIVRVAEILGVDWEDVDPVR